MKMIKRITLGLLFIPVAAFAAPVESRLDCKGLDLPDIRVEVPFNGIRGAVIGSAKIGTTTLALNCAVSSPDPGSVSCTDFSGTTTVILSAEVDENGHAAGKGILHSPLISKADEYLGCL